VSTFGGVLIDDFFQESDLVLFFRIYCASATFPPPQLFPRPVASEASFSSFQFVSLSLLSGRFQKYVAGLSLPFPFHSVRNRIPSGHNVSLPPPRPKGKPRLSPIFGDGGPAFHLIRDCTLASEGGFFLGLSPLGGSQPPLSPNFFLPGLVFKSSLTLPPTTFPKCKSPSFLV